MQRRQLRLSVFSAAALSFFSALCHADEAMLLEPVNAPALLQQAAQRAEDALGSFINRASIEQLGSNNSAAITQVGSSNVALISQTGNFMSATITQIGSGNYASITQRH